MTDNIFKGKAFEEHSLELLQQLGLENLQITKRSNDQGADLIGTFGDVKYVFQCKKHRKKQGNRAVQEAIAAKTYYLANRCGVISESDFTDSAYRLAKPNYCLLFTAIDLTMAINSGQTFLDIIKGYSFPNHVPVLHDFDVIKKYEEVKAKLGHTPTNFDFDPTTRYLIRKKYKNLTNLIAQLGDATFSRKPSKDKIINEYNRIKNYIGKVPTLADMEINSDYSRNCFSCYPFTKLQKECGDSPNIERGVSKEELVDAFKSLSDKLGKTPTLKELDEKGVYRASYYRRRWGTIDNFLQELGISKRHFKQRSYQKQELILLYLLLKKVFEIRQDDTEFLLTHTVLEKLTYDGDTFISPSTFSRRFESWKSFMDGLDKGSALEFTNYLRKMADDFIGDDTVK